MIKDFTCKAKPFKPGDLVLKIAGARPGRYKVVIALASTPGWEVYRDHNEYGRDNSDRIWVTLGFDTPEEAIQEYESITIIRRGSNCFHGEINTFKKVTERS